MSYADSLEEIFKEIKYFYLLSRCFLRFVRISEIHVPERKKSWLEIMRDDEEKLLE
ncbi:hypothetical protein SCHPADRAFT_676940 [Schizopora paradoxa]|uniref:Uncharacterized protein n=1 Tax=Schizopora paradoxa TaxID=27342 RepID=A0A0H2R649_9AGAM|nr:hypothetical protein SCHPADRAFT_676940 [Schizopora paradoxa]